MISNMWYSQVFGIFLTSGYRKACIFLDEIYAKDYISIQDHEDLHKQLKAWQVQYSQDVRNGINKW